MIRLLCAALAVSLTLAATPAAAFCGFFVAKAGGDLFNESSKVVMTRKDGRTVITMANDFKGDVKDFAMVIPVPVVLKRDQIRVSDNGLIDKLESYSAPRVVEYRDEDPCNPRPNWGSGAVGFGGFRLDDSSRMDGSRAANALGVIIEAQYTVGEYDILILSAEESDGLLTWLNQENYKLPKGAERILGSYIRQGLKFFIARVNLAEKKKLGYSYLRPLQVDFETKRFMLPIRLGTLNAKAPQDLILLTITEKGRVETTNYPVRKIPTNADIPLFVQKEFPQFYRAMFDRQVEQANMGAVFLEYAWNIDLTNNVKCDPCVSPPLPTADLASLGVWWMNQSNRIHITRLHARYTAETFPEDLMLHETADRKNFQGRYVTRKAWKGAPACEKAEAYYKDMEAQLDKEAANFAQMTGQDPQFVKDKAERMDGMKKHLKRVRTFLDEHKPNLSNTELGDLEFRHRWDLFNMLEDLEEIRKQSGPARNGVAKEKHAAASSTCDLPGIVGGIKVDF